MDKEVKTTNQCQIFGSFFLNENEFALSVAHVQEVVNPPPVYTQVPLAPNYLLGLLNLRGMIVPVIDLRSILNLNRATNNANEKIVIIEYHNINIGILFDRTGEVFRDDQDDRSDFQAKEDENIISGVFKKNDGSRIIQILDIFALLKLKNIPLQNADGDQQRRQTTQQRRGTKKQAISFSIGDSHCSLLISSIQEILKVDKIEPPTHAMSECIGMLDLRGSTVPVIDFSAILCQREPDHSDQAALGDRRIIVMRMNDEFFGLLVDSIENIISFYTDELIHFPNLNQKRTELFLGCISKNDCNDTILIDHEKIFSHDEINKITQGHSNLYKVSEDSRQKEKLRRGLKKSYITFHLEDMFAIGINEVKEIIDYTNDLLRPPGLPSYFKGILNLRGELITIVDTRAMYQMAKNTDTQMEKVLIFKKENFHYGLIVDCVDEIVSFGDHQKIKLPKVLYQHSSNKMIEDILEAVEVEMNDDGKKSLLILNIESISTRVENKKAA